MQTVAPLEVAWVATMLLGVIFALSLLINAVLDDRERAKRGIGGEMETIAHGKIRSLSLLAVVFLCFGAVGVMTMFLPDRAAAVVPGTVAAAVADVSRWFSPLMFVVGGVLLVVMAGWEYIDYRALLYGSVPRTEDKDAVHRGEPNLRRGRGDGGGD